MVQGIKKNIIHNDDVPIVKTVKEFFVNFKADIKNLKDYGLTIGLIFTVTALFLNIPTENLFLKRVQVLLVLIACLFMIIPLIKITFYHWAQFKKSELYGALGLFMLYIAILLSYNLVKYVWIDFYPELIYYGRWILYPMLVIFINIILILFVRFLRVVSKRTIQIKSFSNFFYFVLNLKIFFAILNSGYNFKETLRLLLEPTVNNLWVVYIFLLLILAELPLFDVFVIFVKRKGRIFKYITIFFIFVVFYFPYIIKMIINLVILDKFSFI